MIIKKYISYIWNPVPLGVTFSFEALHGENIFESQIIRSFILVKNKLE